MARMEAGRRLYNATLGEGLRRHALLKQSKAWQRAREITNKKARSDEFRRLSKEYGFTPAAFITFARQCKNQAGWKDRIGSDVAQRIAEKSLPLWNNTPLANAGGHGLKAPTDRCVH